MAFTFLLHSYLHSSHQSISIDIYSIILLFWVLFITFLNLDSNFHHLFKILNIYWDFVNFRQILYYIFFTQFTLEVLLHGIWSWKYYLIVISLVWFWISRCSIQICSLVVKTALWFWIQWRVEPLIGGPHSLVVHTNDFFVFRNFPIKISLLDFFAFTCFVQCSNYIYVSQCIFVFCICMQEHNLPPLVPDHQILKIPLQLHHNIQTTP